MVFRVHDSMIFMPGFPGNGKASLLAWVPMRDRYGRLPIPHLDNVLLSLSLP